MNTRFTTTIALTLLAGAVTASGQPQKQRQRQQRCPACGAPLDSQQPFNQGRRSPQRGAYDRQQRRRPDGRQQNAQFAPQQRRDGQRQSFHGQGRRPDRFQGNRRQPLTPQQKQHIKQMRKQFNQGRQQHQPQGRRPDRFQENSRQNPQHTQLTPRQREHIGKMRRHFKRDVEQYLSNPERQQAEGSGKPRQRKENPPKRPKPKAAE